MQLEQSQREGNVLVPRFVLLQLRIYCPPTSLGCHGTAGSSQGLCPASTQGVSHFRLQRCWNNAAAHQRAERSPRDVGGEDDPWPHGSCRRLWGAGSQGSQLGQWRLWRVWFIPGCQQSGAQLQLYSQGAVLRFIPFWCSEECFCFQLFQLECSLGKHLALAAGVVPHPAEA